MNTSMRCPGFLAGAGLVAGLLFGGVSGAEARGADLGIGDKAPAISVKEWVQGEPVKEFEKGKIYVVEFWATWCGPCKVSIPHLNELAKKYADKVVVVGVSVWEDDDSGVKPFVQKMGDKMTYRVATDNVPDGDPNNGDMAKNWMTAAGENGIPAAFIVNGDGVIAWIGHPMSMDKALAEVVEGTYDIERAVAMRKAEAEQAAELEKLQGELQRVAADFQEAIAGGRMEKALEVIDKAVEKNKALAPILGLTKYQILALQIADGKRASEYGKTLAEMLKDTPQEAEMLNNMAWFLIDPENPNPPRNPDLDFARSAAERAVKLSNENPAYMDTLALVLYKQGEVERAYELQKKAVELGKDDELVAGDPGVMERLEMYEKAVKEKKAKPE